MRRAGGRMIVIEDAEVLIIRNIQKDLLNEKSTFSLF
jgi:hypothetical protein